MNNLKLFFRSLNGHCHGNQFCEQNRPQISACTPPAYENKGNCNAGHRQTNYLTQCTGGRGGEKNQLTIINRQRVGWAGGLLTGLALHQVVIIIRRNVYSRWLRRWNRGRAFSPWATRPYVVCCRRWQPGWWSVSRTDHTKCPASTPSITYVTQGQGGADTW